MNNACSMGLMRITFLETVNNSMLVHEFWYARGFQIRRKNFLAIIFPIFTLKIIQFFFFGLSLSLSFGSLLLHFVCVRMSEKPDCNLFRWHKIRIWIFPSENRFYSNCALFVRLYTIAKNFSLPKRSTLFRSVNECI